MLEPSRRPARALIADGSVPRLMVTMWRPDTFDLPAAAAPEGFRLHPFQPGDEAAWCRIETAAGEFGDEREARQRFEADYARFRDDLPHRCLLAEDADGRLVGTASALDRLLDGRLVGQLGWVGVVPAMQGRGVGKWLVAETLARLARDYPVLVLDTQTTSPRAVAIYLAFGFRPYPRSSQDQTAWALLSREIGRSIAPPGGV